MGCHRHRQPLRPSVVFRSLLIQTLNETNERRWVRVADEVECTLAISPLSLSRKIAEKKRVGQTELFRVCRPHDCAHDMIFVLLFAKMLIQWQPTSQRVKNVH